MSRRKKSPHISPHTSLIAFDGGKTDTKLSELWTLIKITTQENSTFVAQSRWVEKKRKSPNQPGKLTFEWEFHDKSTDDDVDFCVRFSFAQYNFFLAIFLLSLDWMLLAEKIKLFSISLITNRRNHIKSQTHTITSPTRFGWRHEKNYFYFDSRENNRKKIQNSW